MKAALPSAWALAKAARIRSTPVITLAPSLENGQWSKTGWLGVRMSECQNVSMSICQYVSMSEWRIVGHVLCSIILRQMSFAHSPIRHSAISSSAICDLPFAHLLIRSISPPP
jgi:hypothetical protein